jgi:hypothetical protein
MNFIARNLKHIATGTIALAIGITGVTAFGQDKAKGNHGNRENRAFCSDNDNWTSDDKVSARDLREMSIAATSSLSVDSNQNGGISVRGEQRSDILIRACVNAWGRTEAAAKAVAAGVRISTSGTVTAENTSDDNWSVSYQILVPRNTSLDLKAHNGGISIAGVDGTLEFETTNGGVNLKDVSGNVRGRTTNGGVNVVLSGTSWRGSGLDVTTTNGGVNMTMPAGYAANVETGTVNGGFHSNIPALNVDTDRSNGYSHGRSKRINATINGGGAPIRVVTTNGGVRINTGDERSL